MELSMGVILAIMGAAVSMGLAAIASGIGVGLAGVAGAGVISEDPRKFGPVLVLQALPQTQGIYGFLGAVLILIGVGVLGGEIKEIPIGMGYAALGGGIVVGLSSFTAIAQGAISASGMGAVAKRPETFGQAVVLAVMAETFAIFGLLIAILIFVGSKIMGG
ncbi:MAG: permease [Desulfatiglandales bacterium]|jgi:V/A-type H+-transporting ATPase subunit K|nr:MAG: permease [Deltaproteobacteria bacterium]